MFIHTQEKLTISSERGFGSLNAVIIHKRIKRHGEPRGHKYSSLKPMKERIFLQSVRALTEGRGVRIPGCFGSTGHVKNTGPLAVRDFSDSVNSAVELPRRHRHQNKKCKGHSVLLLIQSIVLKIKQQFSDKSHQLVSAKPKCLPGSDLTFTSLIPDGLLRWFLSPYYHTT